MATTPSDRSVLRGFHDSAREFDDTAAVVRGTLPGWLRGRLLP